MVTRRQTFRLYQGTRKSSVWIASLRYLYNACFIDRLNIGNNWIIWLNLLPAFKKEWVEFAELSSQALQGTVKRVDLVTSHSSKGCAAIRRMDFRLRDGGLRLMAPLP